MSAVSVPAPPERVERLIFAPLARLRRRCRLYVAVDALVAAYLVVLGASLVQTLLDWALKLTVDQRALLSVLVASLWLIVLYRRLCAPLLRRLPDRTLALAVDQVHPELDSRITTAVQFARGEVGPSDVNSPQLVRAVIDEACETALRLSFMTVLNHRHARQRAIELFGLLLGTLTLVAVVPDLAGTWFRRNWLLRETPWPQQTHITPVGFGEDGVRTMPRGDELEIFALNDGRVPKSVELRWQSDSGREGREAMTRVGANRWQLSLGLLTENVSFRIVGGDERTREYVVQAVDRPRVVRTTVRVTPPAYTGLEPVSLEQQTVLEVLAGSTLEIEAQFNRSISSARFVDGGGRPVAECLPLGSDRVRVEWSEPASGSYSFELVDRDGLTNRRPVRYTLKVVADSAPEVWIEMPNVGEHVTPTAELPLEATFEDNYGLGTAALCTRRGVDPPFVRPVEGFEPGRRECSVDTSISLASLGVAPGERLAIWAQAEDRDPRGPNAGRSEVVELRVVTATDLLTELAGREHELRREFERLISAQRGLADALIRLLPELPDAGTVSPALAQRITGLARRQDSHANGCLEFRRRFEQVLGEMQINRVLRAGDERRIGQRIIDPLSALGNEAMPAASTGIAALGEDARRLSARELPDRQAEILRAMNAILTNMLEWEGYREAVALLQEIIKTQSEVREATLASLEKQLEDILGLDKTTEDEREDEPKP